MFLDVIFPESISQGCTVVPRFNNVIVRGQSGRRDAQINWDAPLRKWQVGHTIKDRTTLAEFLDFWITVRGTAYTFRFWDPSDYEAGTIYLNDEIVYDSIINIGTGNATIDDFQLIKKYGGSINPLNRKITKPIASTVKIYLDEVEQASGWTLNDVTGILSFTSPPGNGVVVGWAGHFHSEASFENDEPIIMLDSPQVGEWTNISIMEERNV